MTSGRGMTLRTQIDISTIAEVDAAAEADGLPPRCLALIAHNHMKPAMKAFVQEHKEVLKHFRLTGTNSTITTLKSVMPKDARYGPKSTSGPLGGDAQVSALMALEDVGAVIFFMDPLSAHPHQADIVSLIRLANVHNVLAAYNPTSGEALIKILEMGLKDRSLIPSFYETLQSPSVDEYKRGQQALILALTHAEKTMHSKPNLQLDPECPTEEKVRMRMPCLPDEGLDGLQKQL